MIGFGSPQTAKRSRHQLLSDFLPFAKGELSLTKKRLDWDLNDPFEIYRRLYAGFENSFILESTAGPEELAKHTFLGFNPRATLTFSEGSFEENGEEVLKTSNPLPALKELERRLVKVPTPDRGKFLGGLVGYAGYDLIKYMEKFSPPGSEGPYPELETGLYLDGIVHDSRDDSLTYFSYDGDRSSELERRLAEPPEKKGEGLDLEKLKSDFERQAYKSAVQEIRNYIRAGDVYQTVLSRKLSGVFDGDPFQAYRRLRDINPSPYMYHLKFGDRRIIGSSPEKLVSVRNDEVTTYPIAGTRPLGETKKEKADLRRELISDEKESAEHNMLVDLARNDLGRVADYGTVTVPEYMEVKEFSHVQHLVSRVNGTLSEEKSAMDAFETVFPAGTLSGAPKIRAMEIIEELEVSRRGPYGGGVGYLSFTGDLDTCITIRSLFTYGNRLSLRAGAGIVADSDPAGEWEETNHKLAALKRAISGGDTRETQ